MPEVRILHGDCRAVMRTLDADSVDAVVTDAPYGLSREPDMAEVLRHWLAGDDYHHGSAGFMGRRWDSFVPGPAVWREAIRVLKPGGFCLSFFGGRTYDMGVTAMRLAGFEIREMFAWLHGSGMPKVGYLRDEDGETHLREGWGGSVRPMLEPIVMARKPLSERTLALNVRRWGTGALNVDGCRVPAPEGLISGGQGGRATHFGDAGRGMIKATRSEPHAAGRWPPNVCHDGSQAVMDLFPYSAGGAGGGQSGKPSDAGYGRGWADRDGRRAAAARTDVGSAARFYPAFPPDTDPFTYHPKAPDADRVKRCAACGWRTTAAKPAACPTCGGGAWASHPTVKPQGLMRHYCRLVTPPGGLVLDPFAGSGSTLQAACDEGFGAIGIEMDAESIADCRHRLGPPLPAAAAA